MFRGGRRIVFSQAGRALFRLRFGLFPIPPRTASFLTCDRLIYDSLLSPAPLEDALRRFGVTVAVTAGPALVVTHGDHSIEVTRRSIAPALHAMITVGTMAVLSPNGSANPASVDKANLFSRTPLTRR